MRHRYTARIRLKLARLTLGGLARLWPHYADTRAIELFATPVRPRDNVDPSPAGLPGQRLVVPFRDRAGDAALVAWAWGAGPTIILSHGWNAHASHLAAFIPPLVQAGFRALAFDHLGHGASGGARSNVRGFRDGLLAVARTCEGVAGIIAHSLGATTAVLALDPALDHGLAGLTAKGPAPFALVAPPLDPVRYALDSFSDLMGLSAVRRAAMLQRLRADSGLDADIPMAAALVLRLARAQTRPALIVHDSDDRRVPLADGQQLAAAWPGSRVHLTRGLGHRRILLDPAVVAEVVRFVTGA